ncbi:MAG: response regulator [Candidatus Brocadiia bacterium]|nr:response regulator [Candidatus Brocadiia bacterium]
MKRRKILVVDDEEHVREMIELRLTRFGFQVLHASTGEEALEMTEREMPALVLLDVMLPGVDGFQVCAQLKDNDATRDIPVMMLTAKGEAKDIIRAFDAGAVDYIVKPYDPLILQQKLVQSLGEEEPEEA